MIDWKENPTSAGESSDQSCSCVANRAKDAKIIVIKIGSSTLTDGQGKPDYVYLQSIASQVSAVKRAGWKPIIVTSAAIAWGLEALGIGSRPTDMPGLQAAASVGQSALSAAYAEAFSAHGLLTSLVLLTRRDTADRHAYLHARDTFEQLLAWDVVPIVNENDTISIEQIRFGDNDTLAALVSCLVGADLMVILTDIDGLYDKDPRRHIDARLVPLVRKITPDVMESAGDAGSAAGSGGMVTKLKAARVLMVAGIPLVICQGRLPNIIVDAAFCGQRAKEPGFAPDADFQGTWFAANEHPHEITPRKLWLALGDAARGRIRVDDGARSALIGRGSSLLAVGITGVEGSFEDGDVVDIIDTHGVIVARGRVQADADEVELAMGRTSDELLQNRLLASLAAKPVIHRDDLVVFE